MLRYTTDGKVDVFNGSNMAWGIWNAKVDVYPTDRARPGLVALYDIRPGNGAGQFSQPGARTGRGGFAKCTAVYHFIQNANHPA